MKDFLRQNGILLLVIALLLSILIGVISFAMDGQADPLSDLVNTVASPVRGGSPPPPTGWRGPITTPSATASWKRSWNPSGPRWES